MINCLKGEEVQRVNDIRQSDDRGRHTTTHRELIALPHGGLIIDTPGMRELQVWEVDDGLNNLYKDIIRLSERCHFKNCLHRNEPDCAVQEAIQQGTLQHERLNSYNKMQKEAADLSLKMLGNIGTVEKKKGKKYSQILQDENKKKRKRKKRQ